jgi:hypothetical protein
MLRQSLLCLILATVLSVSVAGQSLERWLTGVSDAVGAGSGENTGLSAFPTLSIPYGGEYEAMGTAYTAVGRDSTYFEANPASSSSLPHTELAVFHNNLIADASLEGAVYTIRFGELGLGAGGKFLHVPFTEYDIYGNQVEQIRYAEGIVGLNASYNFFHSFNFEGVAVGANLKGAYRSIPDRIASGQSAAGVMADLGVLTRFDLFKFYASRARNFSVGATIRNVGPPVQDDPLPSSVHLGVAYQPIEPLLISLEGVRPMHLFSDDPAPAFQYATGVSVAVTDFVDAQAGFHMKGGNPRFTVGSSVELRDITMQFNYTLDMTTQTDELDRFSVQASVNLGDLGRLSEQQRVEQYYLDALVAFAEGNIERTIELCQNALELDPEFQPARDTLETARRMQELQDEMESIQLGDQIPLQPGDQEDDGDGSQPQDGSQLQDGSQPEPSPGQQPGSGAEDSPENPEEPDAAEDENEGNDGNGS